MKAPAIAASLLLALTTPAFAFGDHADWECSDKNKTEITSWKRQISIRMGGGDPVNDRDYVPVPDKGSFNLKWNNKGFWLNGKACTFITDKMVYERGCAKGDKDDCEEFKDRGGKLPVKSKKH